MGGKARPGKQVRFRVEESGGKEVRKKRRAAMGPKAVRDTEREVRSEKYASGRFRGESPSAPV